MCETRACACTCTCYGHGCRHPNWQHQRAAACTYRAYIMCMHMRTALMASSVITPASSAKREYLGTDGLVSTRDGTHVRQCQGSPTCRPSSLSADLPEIYVHKPKPSHVTSRRISVETAKMEDKDDLCALESEG